jgi:hypothetical protein
LMLSLKLALQPFQGHHSPRSRRTTADYPG